MTRVAILNSRQSKTPVGNDPWVQRTVAAVAYAAGQGWEIVSSIGLNTWELVTWAAGRHGARLLLLCPDDLSDLDREEVLRRFALSSERTSWIPVPRGRGRSLTKGWWEERDKSIISAADRVLPVSVRKDGRIENLISQSAGCLADEAFRVPYSSASHHARDLLSKDRLNPDLDMFSDDWLIHWTRACHGPWPGEAEADYYSDLVTSGDVYCRSAAATLGRILAESRLRGSSWRIGENTPVVAFTALSPIESLKLMRWRPRWSRWSFEPYGVAIRRRVAEMIGIRPVRYVEDYEWKSIPDSAKPLTHRKGKKADIWPAEREWRAVGDVPLESLSEYDLCVIVRSAGERAIADRTRDLRVIHFEP